MTKVQFYTQIAACRIFDPKYYEEVVQRARTFEQAEKLLKIRYEYMETTKNVNDYYRNKIEEVLG